MQATKIAAGHYQIGDFAIVKGPHGWGIHDADDIWGSCHDMCDTLRDAVDMVTTWPCYTGKDYDWL